MILLSIKEFNRQSTSGKNSLEKKYQDKFLTAGPAFSLTNFNSAELYCQRFSRVNNGAMCIIVEEKSYFRIWSENNLEIEKKITDNTKIKTKKASFKSLTLDVKFIDVCKEKLAIHIGPIAPVICKKTQAKNPNLTRVEFVEILANKISDPNQAEKFKQELLE